MNPLQCSYLNLPGGQGLISKTECEGGAGTAEVEEFQAGEATQKEEPTGEDTAEDLVRVMLLGQSLNVISCLISSWMLKIQ